MIDSQQNQRVKHITRLQNDRRFRAKENLFVVEGRRWIQELLQWPEKVTAVFYTPDWSENMDNNQLLTHLKAPSFCVSPQIMKGMSATSTPSGVLASVKIDNALMPSTINFMIILDNIRDPGNLGAIVRTAAAAQVDALILSPGCVDLYNPKVVRSTMGTLLHMPIVSQTWPEIEAWSQKMTLYALDAQGEMLYTAVDWTRPSGLIVGSEAHGLSLETQQLVQNRVFIPINPMVESLNAGIAAGIVIFEAVRQKS